MVAAAGMDEVLGETGGNFRVQNRGCGKGGSWATAFIFKL
jgi:hypothetical protein